MGKLYLRYAAMNAGKSTQLLQIEHNYASLGKQVLLLAAQNRRPLRRRKNHLAPGRQQGCGGVQLEYGPLHAHRGLPQGGV